MSKISAWMRTRSQDMAELLVEINVDQFIKGNISGYGMRSRVIELIETLKASLYPTLYASDFNDSAYLGAQVTGSLTSRLRRNRSKQYNIKQGLNIREELTE